MSSTGSQNIRTTSLAASATIRPKQTSAVDSYMDKSASSGEASIDDREARPHRRKLAPVFCLHFAIVMGVIDVPCEAGRPFTLADDVELTYFGDPYSGLADAVAFSPDRRYFVVNTERGRLDISRAESTLWVYRSKDVQEFLASMEITTEPRPVWT